MLLSFEQIKRVTLGALRVGEQNGEFFFERFTEEQSGIYKDRNDSFYRKSYATASVFFDFYTDSESLSFNWRVGEPISRDYYFFDVYEDDLLIGHFGERVAKETAGNAKFRLRKGEKRVRVYLPNLFVTYISKVELDDGASISVRPRRTKALIYGDSITQGYDAYYPSLSYANRIIELLSLDALNQGIGGEGFNPDIIGASKVCKPDVITVAYGANDWATAPRDSAKHERNSRAFFAKLRHLYPEARLFYISPIWRADAGEIDSEESFENARKLFSRVASEEGATVIDGMMLVGRDTGLYYDGRLHPNDLGFEQYALALAKKLREHGI